MELKKPSRLLRALDWLFSFGIIGFIVFSVCYMLFCGEAQASQPSIFVDAVNGAAPPNASGSPEAMSPVMSLLTCHTNGVASTTIEWPANGITLPAGNECNTSNTNCGILFLGTGAGRQYTEILSVAADTVTVEDSFNIAAVSAVDCAVGGRITNVSTQLALDMKGDHGAGVHGGDAGGWQIFLVNSGVNYTWTATRVATSASNGSGFYGVKSGGVRPTVDCNFDPGSCLSLAGSDVKGIEFRNTSGTKTGTIGLLLNTTGQQFIEDVIIGGDAAATAFETGVDWNNNERTIIGSLIRNNDVGIDAVGIADVAYTILSTVFQDNGVGISQATGIGPNWRVIGNIFWGNTTGMTVAHTGAEAEVYTTLLFNTFHDNGTGFAITNQFPLLALVFASNLLTSNTTGVDYSGPARDIERESALVDFNCYGIGATANGANISGFVLGANVINVDPQYEDVATGDFTPTNTDAAFIAWPPGLDGLSPRFFPGTATASQPRCGAIQPAGGVGGFSNVGI